MHGVIDWAKVKAITSNTRWSAVPQSQKLGSKDKAMPKSSRVASRGRSYGSHVNVPPIADTVVCSKLVQNDSLQYLRQNNVI